MVNVPDHADLPQQVRTKEEVPQKLPDYRGRPAEWVSGAGRPDDHTAHTTPTRGGTGPATCGATLYRND